MSTPVERQSAQGLEAQLQKYKEAALNLPRLVKKYKSLESQHAELRKQSDSTAAALEKSQRALSEAQQANVKLKDRLSKVQSEKSTLSVALEEAKSQNEHLLKSAGASSSRDHEDTVSPETKLLADAMKEISALRLEASSLRTELSRSKQGTVLSELTTIRGQMSQLLQRWPKEDAFLTNSSRACTPVHESLASPPLQSMSSLLTHLGSGDAQRACTPLPASQPQDSGKQAAAQASSALSAFSAQALHVHADRGNAQPLASPAHVPECAPHTKRQPLSPMQRSAQAAAAAAPAAPSHTSRHSTAAAAVAVLRSESTTQPGRLLDVDPENNTTSVLPTTEPKFRQPTPVLASSPEDRRAPDNGSVLPKKRQRGTACPAPPPQTHDTKTAMKKKHKSSADRIPKVCCQYYPCIGMKPSASYYGVASCSTYAECVSLLQAQDAEGFMKLRDMPSTAHRRWKPQASGLQQKMMKFGSGTVKSTVVTGSCFNFKRKNVEASEPDQVVAEHSGKTAVDAHNSSGTALNPSHTDKRKTSLCSVTASQSVQAVTALGSIPGCKEQDELECVGAGMQEVSPAPDVSVATVEPHLDTVEHNVPGADSIECAVPQPDSVEHAAAQPDVAEQTAAELDTVEHPAPSGHVVPDVFQTVPTTEAVEASVLPAGGAEGESESFTQQLQKAAPQLLPAVLMSSSGSSSSACRNPIDAQLSNSPENLCKLIAGARASLDARRDVADVATDLSAHWNALKSTTQQREFAAGIVAAIVAHVCEAAASVSEATVLSALNTLKEQGGSLFKLSPEAAVNVDGTSHVHRRLQELLDPKSHWSFNAVQCASVLQQAQAQTSDSQATVCELVAQEICRDSDAAARQLEVRCKDGEMPDPGMLWFCKVQVTTLVGLLDVSQRGGESSCGHHMPHVMQMLAQASDLVAAMGTVCGVMCLDLGRSGMFGTAHESIVRFWDTATASSSQPLPVSSCTLMLQVAMCATSCTAKISHGSSITLTSGEFVWCVGKSTWGWCPAGPHTMQSVCANLMRALESAGTDAESQVWCLLKEHKQFTAVLATRSGQGTEKPTGTAADDASCDTDSSSSEDEDSSDSEDGEDTVANCAVDMRAAHAQPGQELVHNVLHDACQAVTFAARCCGWRWTAHTLLDDTVWPVFEKLQKLDSLLAADIRKFLGDLVGDLLSVVQLEANGDASAAEYVAAVQEALQFVN